MKRLLTLIFAALVAAAAHGATLAPLLMIDPTGSTSGQAVVSTGPTGAPAWANVSAAALTGITPVANGGTAAATLTSHGVLLGQGTSAVTAAAPGAAGTLLTSNGASADPTFQAFSSSSIAGVTNGSNAAAGTVGEYVTASCSAVSLTTSVPANCNSISLSAGDWDVTGAIVFNPAGTTTSAYQIASISTTSATISATVGQTAQLFFSAAAGQGSSFALPTVRFNVTTSTTVYLVGQSNFSVSTMTFSGVIRARRVR